MLRNLLRLVALVIAIAVVRAAVAMILNFFKGLGKQPPERESPAASRQDPGPVSAGVLVQDPVCGTFVSAATSIRRTVDGETVHFCSAACSEKFRGKSA
jgi:YHS domain-containing protein